MYVEKYGCYIAIQETKRVTKCMRMRLRLLSRKINIEANPFLSSFGYYMWIKYDILPCNDLEDGILHGFVGFGKFWGYITFDPTTSLRWHEDITTHVQTYILTKCEVHELFGYGVLTRLNAWFSPWQIWPTLRLTLLWSRKIGGVLQTESLQGLIYQMVCGFWLLGHFIVCSPNMAKIMGFCS